MWDRKGSVPGGPQETLTLLFQNSSKLVENPQESSQTISHGPIRTPKPTQCEEESIHRGRQGGGEVSPEGAKDSTEEGQELERKNAREVWEGMRVIT